MQIKIKKILFFFITTIFIFFLYLILGIYLKYDPIHTIWYSGSSNSYLLLREWYEVLILTFLSYVIILYVLRKIFVSKKNIRIFKVIGALLISFFLLYFAGQNIEIFSTAPIVNERFLFFNVRRMNITNECQECWLKENTTKSADFFLVKRIQICNCDLIILKGMGFAFDLKEDVYYKNMFKK